MSKLQNSAAYMAKTMSPSLTVKDAPYPSSPPSRDHILIRNAAVAINPIDWIIQDRGDMAYTHLKPPFILGYDVSGEVISVGEGVTRFNVGDGVFGLARGCEKDVNDPAQSAFQKYTVLHQDWTTSLVASPGISLEQAAVLPLGVFTAATALFDPTCLGLRLPEHPRVADTGKTVVVWGASTSVGCCAVQMAVAAGCRVFATASPRNHDMLKNTLGAAAVWDYRSGSVVDDIVAALEGEAVAGALSIGGSGSAESCMDILRRAPTSTGGKKHVAMVSFPLPEKKTGPLALVRTGVEIVSWLGTYKTKGLLCGVSSGMVGVTAIQKSGVGRHVVSEYLPKALAAGSFVPAPDAEVVGHGLEAIQDAMATQKKGVSAKKIVVTL